MSYATKAGLAVINKLLFLILFNACIAFSTNRALLIGVGEFPYFPGVSPLSGPSNDVVALKNALIKSWGFEPNNVQTLVNAAATKAGILGEMDRLIQTTQPGDFVLIYFSGHGTSFHDSANSALGLDMRTGAIVPYDFRPGTPAQMVSSLLVGSSDLKKRFLQIQNHAEVMVLFDACFSGESAKFIPQLVARDLEIVDTKPVKKEATIPNVEPTKDEWPYRNLVYISASARNEKAWDIPQKAIDEGGRSTIDGRPHGAFTNGLLAGLSGEADLDHDGLITYRELHQYLMESVQPSFGQTPQLFPKEWKDPLVAKPLLGQKRSPTAVRLKQESALRVKVEPAMDALAAQLKTGTNIRVATKEYDVLARRSNNGYELIHRSGGKMFFGQLSAEETKERLLNLAQAQKIVTLGYQSQPFNVSLSVEEVNQSGSQLQGVYRAGSRLKLTMIPDRPAWLMLVDVDVTGTITVLYPNKPEDLQKATNAGQAVVAVETEVAAPFGTEALKVFAFDRKPIGLEEFMGKKLEDKKWLEPFMRILQSGKSQTTQFVLSIPKQ